MAKRGRPLLGAEPEVGAARQQKYRAKRKTTEVRLETWVPREVATFFRRSAQDQGLPVHQLLAAALIAAASPYDARSED